MPLTMEMQIQGLDALRARMGDARLLDVELRTAEREALALVREGARSGAAQFSSVLPQSVAIETETGGLVGEVYSKAKTALSIEKGRAGSGNTGGVPGLPSYELLERWLLHRGTGAAQTIKGHRYLRPRKRSASAAALHDEAVVMFQRIRAVGTAPHPFIIPAGTDHKDDVRRKFSDAVGRALRKWAGHV